MTIATPTESGAYAELPQASGQVTDAGGAGTARVSILLYRYANGSTPTGFWNGTTWISTFAPQAYRPASVAGSSWSCALPTRSQGMVTGRYALRAFASDGAGNKAVSSAVSFFIAANNAPMSDPVALILSSASVSAPIATKAAPRGALVFSKTLNCNVTVR